MQITGSMWGSSSGVGGFEGSGGPGLMSPSGRVNGQSPCEVWGRIPQKPVIKQAKDDQL